VTTFFKVFSQAGYIIVVVMGKLDSLIGMIDHKAGLRIEAVLSAFDGYQLPQWMRSMNNEDLMFEWWSIESYLDENDKKYVLFTYNKLQKKLKVYYELEMDWQ
jgi:hypothetical protein